MSDVLPPDTDLHITDPRVQQRVDRLFEACERNLKAFDRGLVERAFRLARWAHRNDMRASGEPYIIHPLDVATILVEEIPLDSVSVAAALLHDVVEDTDISLDLIRDEFGPTMRSLVDGLTKISGVFESRSVGNAENVRKLVLSMASDVRVILVKFADRLHNMRTLEALREGKQQKIARETLDLYAPLAHRFGLFRVKNELEDLSLRALHPDAYYDIVNDLKASRGERERQVASFIEPLEARLHEAGLDCEVYGRPKHIYSIYGKMQRQNKTLDEIYDLLAIRVVLDLEPGEDERAACWRVYSIVTDLYAPNTSRIHDYVSRPKSNGYKSLHTTVFGPNGRPFEVQIRTRHMHEIAEKGVAAHWRYKEDLTPSADPDVDSALGWVRELLDAPQAEKPGGFVEDLRLNLYDNEIHTFTPQGKLITMPLHATPVDFAFQVHTEIGFHCIGAKVNGKMVPLSYALQNGDQVEIITSKKQTPNPDWMKFVVTHKAQSRIRQWANEKRRKAIDLGRDIWEKRAKKAGLSVDPSEVRAYAVTLKFGSAQDLFYEVGTGHHDVDALIRTLKGEDEESSPGASDLERAFKAFVSPGKSSEGPSIVLEGEDGYSLATEYASCCTPIPGDKIFGFTSRNGVVRIHRASCRNAPNLYTSEPDRIVDLSWSREKDATYSVGLRVMGEDRRGLLNDLTDIISKTFKMSIRSVAVESEEGFFEGLITLNVSDLEQLKRVMKRLNRVEGVSGVYRLEV
jgi:RelA/SpoT family (p)ppGpp synthetase